MRKSGRGLVVIGAMLLGGVALPVGARAEPYIAVREGLRCASCHANLTGGGLRKSFGRNYSRNDLPVTYWAPWPGEGKEGEASSDSGFADQLARYFSAGVDFRAGNTTRHQPASSVGPTPEIDANEFAVREANLYLAVHVIPEHLSFYLDEQVVGAAGTSAFAREAFALLEGMPYGLYVKAGMFYLPYGLRLYDDSAFIRSVTGVNFAASDVGVEIGADPGPFSLRVALSNGTRANSDTDIDKEVSILAEVIHKRARLGASVDFNDMPGGASRFMHNVFAGVTLWRVSVLGELDRIVDDTGSADVKQYIAYVEADVLLAKGVNVKGVYEYLDPSRSMGGDGQHRVSALLEVFPTQFTQVTLGARIGEGPKAVPVSRADEYFVEAHVFF